jgi:hypothetical protein
MVTNISGEWAASIISAKIPENGVSTFLQNTGYQLQDYHGAINQNTAMQTYFIILCSLVRAGLAQSL